MATKREHVVHLEPEGAALSVMIVRLGKNIGRLQIDEFGVRWVPKGKHRDAQRYLSMEARIPWEHLKWLQHVVITGPGSLEYIRKRFSGG